MATPESAPAATGSNMTQKRKVSQINDHERAANSRHAKRIKTRDARSVLAQTDDASLTKGELNLQTFLKTREFEIKALENGMQKSKGALSRRAFQQVPRDLRRRTASHNVKRVPRRLQNRARREMVEDNTPTVTPSKRKPRSTRARLRTETAKRLGLLAARKKEKSTKAEGAGKAEGEVITRSARPKIRRNELNEPPKPKSKFRKRQAHKTWLPTHMWHAKRAKTTEPKDPLWRFSIPLTPTEKCYRLTHRAIGSRGAVVWDMSYMSTIGLHGAGNSLEHVLRKVGITDQGLWDLKGEKWRTGKRIWSGWLSKEANGHSVQIAPAIILRAASPISAGEMPAKKASHRSLFIRIHPAAFLETWTEILRLSQLQRPSVHVEDLRFEIGSIEITGPGSTEALLGILHPIDENDAHAKTFMSLKGVTNPASLPLHSLLSFSVLDPRLRYPPRPVEIPVISDEGDLALLQTLSEWSIDSASPSRGLFERESRFKASRLPSQKAINRRKGLAAPGEYPPVIANDHPIPVILHPSRDMRTGAAQGTWTLLAPWKCILPIWYGLLHYPLSSGGNPRFGGLNELRQTYFERGMPWFPADYPASQAGLAWELQEREERKSAWEKRPKGKRVEWATLDLGAGRKGEHGCGWACDFEWLVKSTEICATEIQAKGNPDECMDGNNSDEASERVCTHMPRKRFESLIYSLTTELPLPSAVVTVRISFISSGVATTCARIYRLPTTTSQPSPSTSGQSELRQQWLSLIPPPTSKKPTPDKKKHASKDLRRLPLDIPIPQRIRLLAQSLLQDPPLQFPSSKGDRDDKHPMVPDQHDLIGFVTTGNFNLAEGKGVAIGTVLVTRTLEGLRESGKGEGKVCIVRNAGETVGRLARWEAV